MKESRWIAIAAIVATASIIGLWQINTGQAAVSSRILYLLIGVAAAISLVAIFFSDRRTVDRKRRVAGDERGPEPGDGAVIHHSTGEADFDGLPGNVPPPIKDPNRDLPYPHKKAAD